MAPPKKPAQPTPAPDLAGLLAGLGIDPSSMDGAALDANDPPVYLGMRPKRTTFGIAKSLPRPVKTTTSKAYARFYKMEQDELEEFQSKAFAAGLYGTRDGTKVRFGDYDENSFKLWRMVVDRAANFYQAGKKVTPTEALDMAIAARGGGAEGDGRQGGGNVYTVETADPVAVSELADKLSQDEIGRKLDKGARERLVARVIAEQRAAQMRVIGAQESASRRAFDSESGYLGSTVVDNPRIDVQARLAERIRQEYGVEAGAADLADQGNAFFQLLNEVGG